jgi:hypothetical protein
MDDLRQNNESLYDLEVLLETAREPQNPTDFQTAHRCENALGDRAEVSRCHSSQTLTVMGETR